MTTRPEPKEEHTPTPHEPSVGAGYGRVRAEMVDEPRLRLVMRQNCHLCRLAEEDLVGLGIKFESFDVDTDIELSRIYGDFIPVLLAGITEVARAPIIGSEVTERLKLLGQPQARR